MPVRCSIADRAQPVALGLLGRDRLELADRHLGVGLVVELGHVARDALEDHDAAGARIAHGVGEGGDVERLAGDADVDRRAAADRRHERDLVAGAHRRVGRRVLAVDRHHALARPQLADRRACHRREDVGHAGAVRQLDLEPVGAGPFTQAGEEAD